MKLQNKVAIITGSSRGIGKAIALLFAKEGAKVVVNCNTSMDRAEQVVSEITKQGGQALAIQCDVSQEEQVKHLIEQTVKHFGRLDILVNNAGVVFDVPFLERTVKQWKQTLDTNLLGTFLCTKYASQEILKQDSGAIVNISSSNGIDSFSPDAMDYDASKAGINIITRSFAKELAPKIRVNTIAPGWVDTEMNQELPQEFIDEEKEKIYLKRFADPSELANVALFLVSKEASFVTGSILKIDGGYRG